MGLSVGPAPDVLGTKWGSFLSVFMLFLLGDLCAPPSPFIILVVGFQLGVEANKCVHFINPIGSFNRKTSYITTKRTPACSCMILGNYS